MKTIEERADEKYCDKDGYVRDMAFDYKRIGYIAGATEQKSIDIDKIKQWFAKWWESNEYLPLDVCLKSIAKAMEE